MRRIAMVAVFIVVACTVGALIAVVWVDRALAGVKESPDTLCLTTRDREAIISGDFPLDRQDKLVVTAINFDQGVPRMGWWHLRGAAIHLTYVTFWSPSTRTDAFSRIASRLKDCPQR